MKETPAKSPLIGLVEAIGRGALDDAWACCGCW
jgi:hypothetical protein